MKWTIGKWHVFSQPSGPYPYRDWWIVDPARNWHGPYTSFHSAWHWLDFLVEREGL